MRSLKKAEGINRYLVAGTNNGVRPGKTLTLTRLRKKITMTAMESTRETFGVYKHDPCSWGMTILKMPAR